MRLREIQKVITSAVDKLTLQKQQVGNFNPPQYQLGDVLKVNEGLAKIESLGLFVDDMETLRVSSLYNNPNDSIRVNQQEYLNITKALTKIEENSVLLLEAIKSALGSENLIADRTISVKIKSVENLDDLSNTIEKLKKIIQLPVAEYQQGGEIKIENFDSGSFWLDILLPTAASITLVGTIAWAGAVIYKKYQEAFAFRNYAEGLKIQKDHLENLKEAAKQKIEMDIEAEAKLIQNQFFDSDDMEQLNRLKLSIKEYSKLIQKGVEIQPALAAPEKISNLFPNYRALNLIESKVKQLSNESAA